MKRMLKEKLKKLLRLLFEQGQRLGVSILPQHFYSQIPNISELRRDGYWLEANTMYGVAGADLESQLQFAAECCSAELVSALPRLDIYRTAIRENGEDAGYGPIEAEFLYCFVRTRRPQKICQIGCGVSTSILLRAAADAGYQPEIICVEPFPMPFLVNAHAEGRIKLIKEIAQKVPLTELTTLSANDFLFVDSTHTVKPGSEVNRVILEVLPRLSAGVWVHFHDIYFPYDYKRDLLESDLFFWSESTLLHAFLAGNRDYAIRTSLSMLHYGAPEKLKTWFDGYDPQGNRYGLREAGGNHFPSATYLQRT